MRKAPPSDLDGYLGGLSDDDRVLRLATSVATVFDEYVMYRPEMLRKWAKGAESHWQAQLWRKVASKLGTHDLASRIDDGVKVLRAGSSQDALPLRRLQLFSLETLPPLFLRFFSELGRVVPTTVYLLEPSEARSMLGCVTCI